MISIMAAVYLQCIGMCGMHELMNLRPSQTASYYNGMKQHCVMRYA